MVAMMGHKVVFSALYNESDEFLPHFIKNFLNFTGADEILLINVNPGRLIPLPLIHESGRIFLFNGSISRHRLGHTLLMGHIESFDYALNNIGNFDFFCPIASNSLFFRKFNFPDVFSDYSLPKNNGYVSIDNLPDSWWYNNVKKCDDFMHFLKNEMFLDNLSGWQIEGFFSSKDNWAAIHKNQSNITRSAALVPPDLNFPFEEILPRSIILKFGTSQMSSICHNFWAREGTLYGNVTISDILWPNVPDRICLMKWFERSFNNLMTFAVIDEWAIDTVEKIRMSIQLKKSPELIRTLSFFDSLQNSIRGHLSFIPFTQAWPGITDGFSCAIKQDAISIDRKILQFNTGCHSTSGSSSAYLYFEASRDVVDIDVKLSYNANSVLEVSCARINAQSTDVAVSPALEGYVYISPLRGSPACFFRLRFPLNDPSSAGQVMSRPVIFHNGVYRVASVAVSAIIGGYHEYYIRHEALPSDVDIWLGLPFYDDSNYTCLIDITYDEPL